MSTIKLSQVTEIGVMTLLRNGEFRSLGSLSQHREKMLVTFYDPEYLQQVLQNSYISCVITTAELAANLPSHLGVAVCKDAMAAFYRIHHYLLAHTCFYGDDDASNISPEAVIHERAYVAPRNVRIGRGTVVAPGAVILEKSCLGEDVTIGPGTVIGGEGFEPKWVEGRHIIVRHAGGVHIGHRVEIQANSHVAKAVFNGSTQIGEDTKIDAMVHIAHNVQIGRRCELAACAVVAGSATIGDDVWIGPNATVSSEITVGNRAFLAIGSVVVRDVREGQRVFGVPAKLIGSVATSSPATGNETPANTGT
jgi:UDP-3-O-[3-hydroxymyristoyl] glucosamine N-acyltransferase